MTFVDNAEIGVQLLTLQAEHPDIVRAFAIGSSVQGRELWGALISSEPDGEAAEPEVRIIGGIHGDECMSVDLVLELAKDLAGSYGVDPEVTRLVDESQLLLVPSVNPDGRASLWASRTNANGVDLNRNLGFAWVNGGGALGEGPSPFSEPETRSLREISQERNVVLGLSYHTRAEFVNGAWNYTPHHPPDEDVIAALGEAYAGDSGYTAGFGWDWYAINGDVNDWSLGTSGTLDWTIELRRDLQMEWELHRQAVLRFLAFVHRGIRGVVTDARTGEPLVARIEVDLSAARRAPVFTDPVVGDYHRIVLPGTYTVTAVAQGFSTLSVHDVVVGEGELVDVDFALSPLPNGAEEHGLAINQMTLPEPILNDIYLEDPYLNRSLVWSALGPPDGEFYSMSPGGSLTIDLGDGFGVLDGEGDDLRVVSGTSSDDPLVVAVSEDQDGPFVEIGGGTGTFALDLASAGIAEARYVRLLDVGDGPFNVDMAGYDVDAVVNLSPRPRPDAPPDGDADGDADADGEGDSSVDADADGDASGDAGRPTDADVSSPDPPDATGANDADGLREIDRNEGGCACRAGRRSSGVMWELAKL